MYLVKQIFGGKLIRLGDPRDIYPLRSQMDIFLISQSLSSKRRFLKVTNPEEFGHPYQFLDPTADQKSPLTFLDI